jgi:glutathione S-transferase
MEVEMGTEAESVKGLVLYHTRGCPYCVRVRQFLDQAGRSVELRDLLGNPDRFVELIAATGRRTVPCLRIETAPDEFEWLHESADIIDYLAARFAEDGEQG